MDCVTRVAGLKPELPAWLAAMVHIPAATLVTIFPLTVQVVGVMLLKLTGRPEVAVAETILVPPTVIVVDEKLRVPMV